MDKLICQSCSMEFKEEEQGTNTDGSKNKYYCIYCFKDGKFTQDMTLEEYIEFSLQFAKDVGMTEQEMREYCIKTLPTLKRWNNSK